MQINIYINSQPLKYCLDGYNNHIFKAVLLKDEEIVRQHLRLSMQALEKVICYSTKFLSSTKGWKKHFYVTVFLYWLGCGASYRVTGASLDISRYTVRDIVHQCLDGFMQLVPVVIKYPTEDMYADISQKLNNRAGTHIFHHALGAIDGSHVRISVPTRLRDQYMNRKAFTSLQFQAVCSGSGEFLSICVGYPGSVHDERVLKNSRLFKDKIFPPPGYYLLGDSGYKCRLNPICIITPFKRTAPLSIREIHFNKCHSKARSIIESAFGLMKTRWRSLLDNVLHLSISNCTKAIAVACVMHNICLNDGFQIDINEISDTASSVNEEELLGGDEDPTAIAFRRTLADAI